MMPAHQTETSQVPARWYDKVAAVLTVILYFELGLFLLIFPWVGYWETNYFSSVAFQLHQLWISPYFRGAISGVGALNIYISFLEVFRLRRFAANPDSQ